MRELMQITIDVDQELFELGFIAFSFVLLFFSSWLFWGKKSKHIDHLNR